jgi:hypothetical protein
MNAKWRPMMGWLYMATCTFDFVIFPILWSLLQSIKGIQVTQWQPLTLQGAGLYHIAMGAVLGLAAFGRTQEKLAGANNGGMQPPPSNFGAPAPSFGQPSQFGAPPSNFGAAPSGFGAPARPPGNFNAPAAAMGGLAVGAAAGVAVAGADPAQPAPMAFAPPQPSRPPLEDDHPELD